MSSITAVDLLDHLFQKANIAKVYGPLILTELSKELTTNGLLIYHVAIAYVCMGYR